MGAMGGVRTAESKLARLRRLLLVFVHVHEVFPPVNVLIARRAMRRSIKRVNSCAMNYSSPVLVHGRRAGSHSAGIEALGRPIISASNL